MFFLLDSFFPNYLNFVPSLGCASLLGACRETGIQAQYFQTQKIMYDILFDQDTESILDAVLSADTIQFPQMKISSSKNFRSQVNVAGKVYQHCVVEKKPRSFFEFRNVKTFFEVTQFLDDAIKLLIKNTRQIEWEFIDRIVDRILDANPRLIGFSTTMVFDPLSREIRRQIKQRSDIPVVVGGCHTPFLQRDSYKAVFEREYLDYLVVGQAELALPRLFSCVTQNQEPEGVPNVFYLKEGSVCGTAPEVIQDLDVLPLPDFSLFDLDGYFSPVRILPLMASRGCAWRKCAFCSHEAYSQGVYKTHKVSRVIANILDYMRSYQTNHFFFNDAELPPKLIERISDGILAQSELRDRIQISFLARLEKGFLNPGLLGKMRSAGFKSILWGLESGSQFVLDRMRKGIQIEEAEAILKKAHENDIANSIFLIFGFPGEMPNHRQETIDFVKRNREYLFHCITQNFYLAAYSPMAIAPEKWGLSLMDDGSWVYQDGEMTSDSVNDVWEKISRQRHAGVFDGKYTSFMGSHEYYHSKRMMVLMFKSRSWISPEECETMVASNQLGQFYPIMPDIRLFRQVLKKAYSYHFYRFDHPFFLDVYQVTNSGEDISLIAACCIHGADGTQTVNEILERVSELLKAEFPADLIESEVRAFFRRVLLNHQAVGFKESW